MVFQQVPPASLGGVPGEQRRHQSDREARRKQLSHFPWYSLTISFIKKKKLYILPRNICRGIPLLLVGNLGRRIILVPRFLQPCVAIIHCIGHTIYGIHLWYFTARLFVPTSMQTPVHCQAGFITSYYHWYSSASTFLILKVVFIHFEKRSYYGKWRTMGGSQISGPDVMNPSFGPPSHYLFPWHAKLTDRFSDLCLKNLSKLRFFVLFFVSTQSYLRTVISFILLPQTSYIPQSFRWICPVGVIRDQSLNSTRALIMIDTWTPSRGGAQARTYLPGNLSQRSLRHRWNTYHLTFLTGQPSSETPSDGHNAEIGLYV